MAIIYFNIIIFNFWFLSALADYGQFCYLWQLKEYRLDRLRDYRSTLSGKKFFRGWRIFKRPLIYLTLFLALPVNFELLNIAVVAVLSIDLICNLLALAAGRNLLCPKLTVKAGALVVFSLLVEGILFFIFLNSYLIFIILALRWFIFSALAIAAKLPTGLAKLIYLKIAENKLLKFNKLAIIGVTGSYGKTTVKNFLAQILGEKYKVIITPENINTEIGIAKFIIKNNLSDFDIFIVEMGTYKIGEIAVVSRLVKPKIGILTAINEQHLSLLGTIKNTQTAKYELLRSLPADGLAITNSDNIYCREFLAELKCRVLTFGQESKYHPDCLINNIKTEDTKLKFTATIKKQNGTVEHYDLKTELNGAHNAMNIAPALLIAEYFKLAKLEIIKQTAKLKLPESTLKRLKYGQNIIIDDSYNANPDGFKAALKFLAALTTAGKKIVISRGLLELGPKSQELHKQIGRLIAKTAHELIIISEDYAPALKSGALNSNLKIQSIFDAQTLLYYFKQNKNQPNIILMENRMPEIIMAEINKYANFQ